MRYRDWLALLAGGLLGLSGHLPAEEPKPAAPASQAAEPLDPEHAKKAAESLELFKTQVKPILMQHCIDCHGGKSIKGDFDISTREKLLASGYVEKTAEASYLFKLITHEEEPGMPYKQPKLPAEQIELIKKWIDTGFVFDAPLAEQKDPKKEREVTDSDRQFWSFKPLGQAPVPAVKDSSWVKGPIDQYILAAQEAKGLHPNAEADRLTLIRRAYLDLLGLPPTPEEVDAFLADTDPQAYEKLVDRLLESPRYGERWARHWIDIARFAESHGYEQDYDRPTAHHYRDFLIRAFNSDMPYDQFVKWQLAGDELAPTTPDALMATGFLGAGAFPTQLTEDEFERARYDELDDMTATTGVAFLGLSIGCARCHDHKYDPIPVRDYYQMAACFSSAIRSEVELDLTPEENQKRREQFEATKVELTKKLADLEQGQLAGQFQEWLKTFEPATSLDPWEVLEFGEVKGDGGTVYVKQPDGSWLAQGKPPAKENLVLTAKTKRAAIRSLRIEALAHDSLPAKGPGRAGNGNFVLGDVKLSATDAAGSREIKLANPRATHQQNTGGLSIAASLDESVDTGWAVDAGGIGKDQAAVVDLAEPAGSGKEVTLTIRMAFQNGNPNHLLGRFRISITDREGAAPAVGGSGPDAKVREALAAAKAGAAPGSDAFQTAFEWYKQSASPVYQAAKSALDKHLAAGPGVQLTKVLVTTEGLPKMSHHANDRGFPHFYPEMFLLKRGDLHQKVEPVQPGFLRVLMPAATTPEKWKVAPPEGWTRTRFSRASLANWIMDPVEGAGQLAARVMVNRLWQHHFGRGLVATPSDFGFQGDKPSHPELLDKLARDLIDNGWKLKPLHRAMMVSATYRQSTQFDEARAAINRENTLLWRMTPQRLEAEPIRDSLLSVSGQLDLKMFGPGTLDQNMKRRSIYFFIKRSQLVPMMMLFDWPEHLVSIGQRANTTVAPQALMFLNSPQGHQYGAALAGRLQGDLVSQITQAYRLCYGRVPNESEQQVAQAFLAQQTEKYKAASHANPGSDALADLCQALLASSEFVYRP